MLTAQEIDLALGDPQNDPQVFGWPAAKRYAEARGISSELMDALSIRVMPANELLAMVYHDKSYDDRVALVIPHPPFGGGPHLYWSARMVEVGPRLAKTGLAAKVATKEKNKMFCPPGVAPVAYLPPTLDWNQLQTGDTIYIHESAIKAINGARLMRWSIGINGVRGWSAMKRGLQLVDGLSELPWKKAKLKAVIVFDSNTEDSHDVQEARILLAAKLKELYGTEVRQLDLPRAPDGTHQGFDDYCMRVGDEEATAFLDQEGEEVEADEGTVLRMELNARVCLVRSLSKIAEIATGTLMSKSDFTDVNYATWTIQIGDAHKNYPRIWIAHKLRNEVEGIDYIPGAERIADDKLNTWLGMGCQPVAGDVQPWLALLAYGVPDPTLRAWVLAWLAYPLQNIGAKMTTFIHLFGPPRSGKNSLLLPFEHIYGDNAVSLGRERIVSDFNAVYARKQFLNLDELHGGNEKDSLHITNKIKMLTTAPKLAVNTKNKPEYMVKNHVQLVTTSNYVDSIKLDEGDQRACVIKFGERTTVIQDKEYWRTYRRWLDGDGPAALYHYLLGLDLSEFDPFGWAPMTPWKEQVTDSTRSALEKWVRALWEDPDDCLTPMLRGAKVLTSEQLAACYKPGETIQHLNALANSVGQRMADMDFLKVELKIDGKKQRLWVVGDKLSKWDNERVRVEFRRFGGKF